MLRADAVGALARILAMHVAEKINDMLGPGQQRQEHSAGPPAGRKQMPALKYGSHAICHMNGQACM